MRTNGGSAMRSIPSRRSVLNAVTPQSPPAPDSPSSYDPGWALSDSSSSCDLGWASDDLVSGRDDLEGLYDHDLYFDDYPDFVVRNNYY